MLSVLHSSEGRLSGYQVFLGRVNVKYLYKHPMCVCKCLYEGLCLCLCVCVFVCVCVCVCVCRSEEHTSELQSHVTLVCRLHPRSTLSPYTTLSLSSHVCLYMSL